MSEESTSMESIDDLEPKMRLEGTVTGTGLHGATVDIGLEQEGLLHISQLVSDDDVDRVADAVQPGDSVTVWVSGLFPEQNRVGLTMIKPPDVTWDELTEGEIHVGTVTRIESYGAFVDIGAERPGLLHVREMSPDYVDHPSEIVSMGDEIGVRVLKVDRERRRIDLTRQGVELEQEPEEEEEKVPRTSMEVALERAYADQEQGEQEAEPTRPAQRRQADFSEQEEILKRTLEDHSE